MINFHWISTRFLKVKGLFVLSVFLMLFESIALISTVGLQQSLIDDVLIGGEFEKFTKIFLLMGVAFVAYAILFTLSPLSRVAMDMKLRMVILKEFMQYMYKIPTSKLQNERTGTYVHHITQDIDRSSASIMSVTQFIRAFFTASILMVMVYLSSPILLLIITVLSLFYIFLGKYFSERLKERAKAVQQTKSDLIVHIEEGISSTREVIAFHRHQWEAKIYEKLFKRYYANVMEEGKLENKKIIMSEPFKWGVNVVILAYGGFLVMQSELSLGMFVITYQFSLQLMDAYQEIFDARLQLSNNVASIERIRNVIEGEKWGEGKKKLKEIQHISFQNVSFRYEKNMQDVLQNVSFDIPIGKKIAFVGSSGGGKSTIAQLLIRFFEPTSGEINVNGEPLHQIRRKDWMSNVSIVFQEPYLFPDTLRNNLLLGCRLKNEDSLVEACQLAKIHDFITSLPDGYDTVIGERGITLSGGQRQRIAIARAILQNPELLILDEATSALDYKNEYQVQSNLDQYRKGKTSIIIAHRLSTFL